MHRRVAAATAIAIMVSAIVRANAASQTFRIDSLKSRTTIHVGKAGMFSFMAGHTHEITGSIESGEVQVDADAPARARIRLRIATSALRVSAADEPEGDAPKVQEAMDGPKVLDTANYPRITFESTAVTVKSGQVKVFELLVAGQLTIRDVSRPITVPVHAELSESSVTATGRLTVKQAEYGIRPISVGGVVAVKDDLQIDFAIVATR